MLNNPDLNAAISILPANYNFEIHKTIWRVKQANAKKVALQFPEGLLMYACVIADILEAYGEVEETMIMGDVTFGACCIDDYSAAALGAEFLIHYGHSCLVPVDITSIPAMYVFVDIRMDTDHFVDSIALTLPTSTRIVLAGTIQFASSMQRAREKLELRGYSEITVPQSRPLSAGEVLGCTAPKLPAGSHDAIVFVADGRFHLEALMIANPHLPAYRYDPYGRILTLEEYDHEGMKRSRRKAIESASLKVSNTQVWGLVLGTLGRQGNPQILDKLKALLDEKDIYHVTVLLSEVIPSKLAMLGKGIDVWVQIACPRLSIDWGDEFEKPTLNPYEAFVALGAVPGWWEVNKKMSEGMLHDLHIEDVAEPSPGHGHTCSNQLAANKCNREVCCNDSTYPMDYYAADGGDYNSSYHRNSGSRKAQNRCSDGGKSDFAARIAALRKQRTLNRLN